MFKHLAWGSETLLSLLRRAPDSPKTPSGIREFAEIGIAALLIALIVRSFFFQAFKIPSGSMLPTLQIGDHLLVNKISYGVKIPFVMKTLVPVGEPQREDIIVFIYPQDRSKDYIKRVLGMPGDVIEIRNKQLFLNGKLYKDKHGTFLDPLIIPGSMQPRDNFGPVKIPDGSVFVMGDNRDYSTDSRFWGFVEFSDVIGKVEFIFFSWDHDQHRIRWDRIGRIPN
jgi:signal peptidase I